MNDHAQKLLVKLQTHNFIPHTLLFTGSDEAITLDYALKFTKNLLCKGLTPKASKPFLGLIEKRIHPDFHFVDEIPATIQKIRELKRKFAESPLLSRQKIAVISGADYLRPESANALLKLLEEPPADSTLILLAKTRSAVLPTIASRCFHIRVARANCPAPVPVFHRVLAVMQSGSLQDKFRAAENFSLKNKNELSLLLDHWLVKLRGNLLAGNADIRLMRKIINLKQIVLSTNANPRLLLEELIVSLYYA